MTSLDKAPVEDVLISRIDIGGRRREKPRVTAKFIRSIQDVGLIHPIVIRPNGEEGRFELVAGQRRLEAFRSLGRAKIPARIVTVDDEGLRDIEYDENVERLDFLTHEQAASRLQELKRQTAAVEASDFRIPSIQKSGRPREATSDHTIARATGVPRPTVEKLRHHVEAGERYPILKDPIWRQAHALDMAKILDSMPVKVRNTTAEMVEQEVLAVDTRNVGDAAMIIKNMANFPPEKQQTITELYRSKDPRERSLAITTAAKRPPMPDLRIDDIDLVLKSLTGIVRASKDELHDYIKKEIGKCQTILETVKERVKAAHKEKLALVAS